MRITNVRINGISYPVGFRYDRLVCSWNVRDAERKKQAYAVIEVSESKSFETIVYRKEGEKLRQGGETLEIGLKPRTVYYVRIRVTGEGGEPAESEACPFETGKMEESWDAEWISPGKEDVFHPVLKKTFVLKGIVKRARVYVCGAGLFEVSVDGEKLGDEYLTPYINHYETNLQVITLPVEQLSGQKGKCKTEHDICILLGKGWYMGVFGLDLKAENYGNRMAAIAELHIEYEDGSREVIATDDTWQYRGSDIEDSGIYLGEILNRQLWDSKENPWKPVEVLKQPEGEEGTRYLSKSHLCDRMSLPVRVMEEMEVQEVIRTPAGETVLDMGQNFTGFMEFTADLPEGTRIVLDFGEILQGGNFYHKNYRDAKSQFVYVSNGTKETAVPHFTFFGFRYVRVSGWPGELKKEQFCGKALYSELRRTGYLNTCHSKLNRLYENTVWGLKSNFLDMPTDCPQRSERLGWTGDAQVFAPTACYHMDTRAFFRKFMRDLRAEQKILEGGMPNFLPNIGHRECAGSVWGDIATFLPDTLYTYYGNLDEMEEYYPMMKDWVDYIDRRGAAGSERRYLVDFMDTFGDWLALDGATPSSFKGSTDDTFISSVYYCRSIRIVLETAQRLKKKEDAARYGDLEQKVRQAIFQEFFTPSGRLAIDTQAAYVIALKFGVYRNRRKVIGQLKERLKKDLYQIKCGFVGAPLLCTVLAEAGEYELAYDFLLNEGFPGWLYSVDLGATTVWERWNSVLPDGTVSNTGMNSLNHYAYGSVMEFVYAYVAGIRPLEAGFRKALIEPHPDIRLREVNCSYDSVNGLYVCNWKIEKDGAFCAHVEIPFHCEAEVLLPGNPEGKQVLECGSYDFRYNPAKDLRKPYSKKTTLRRLSQDSQAMAALKKHTPSLAGIAASGDPEMAAHSLEEISRMGFLHVDPLQLARAAQEISELVVV